MALCPHLLFELVYSLEFIIGYPISVVSRQPHPSTRPQKAAGFRRIALGGLALRVLKLIKAQ